MARSAAILATLTLLLSSAAADSLYPKSSKVLQVDAKSYERLIAKTNYTSIVEFYAPWCGHCKNLQPAYEKAASSLAGLARVAAVNCDEDSNKPFCGSMGVQGFPTLKIVKPARKKGGKAVVEDYQGGRTAKAIVDAVSEKIPNHVVRVKDSSLDKFVGGNAGLPKAIVFSEKGLVSSLVKALAIDFLGSLEVGYARSADTKVVERYGITEFPAVVLLPAGEGEAIKYDGTMKKPQLVEFLSQAAPPNPDATVDAAASADKGKGKPKSKSKPKKGDTKKADTKKADKKQPEAAEGGCPYAAAGGANPHTVQSETVEHATTPLASPDPNVATDVPKPVNVKTAPIIPSLSEQESLERACLNVKSTTCILAILPKGSEADAETPQPVLGALSDIHYKHASRGAKIFPFYSVLASNEAIPELAKALSLGTDKIEVVAINAKKSWWRRYEGEDLTPAALEKWVDDIRFGDFSKSKLPDGLAKAVKATEPPKETILNTDDLIVELLEEHDEL